MPLRSRVALIATLLVVAAIAVNTVLQTFAARRAVLDQARAGGDSIAEVLARAVAFAEEVPKSVEEEIGHQMKTEAQLVAQYVLDLRQLEFGVADQGDLLLLELDRRCRSLEIETGADLLVGLIQCIAQLDQAGLAHDIKRGHGLTP